jgi:carbonic anhydrase
MSQEHPRTPDEALRALEQGNERHRAGRRELRDYSPVADQASEQRPFAAIIACADSRVAPELIFDLERGNVFTSRVAGNSIDDGTLGSTEYAVAVLGVPLVMVLGHSDCGAVKAAIDVVNGEQDYPQGEYGAIGSVVDNVVRTVKTLPEDEHDLERCVSENARSQAEDIAGKNPIIKPAVEEGELRVVAAVYEISSGKVSVIP